MHAQLSNDMALLERLCAEHGSDLLVRLVAAGYACDTKDALAEDEDLDDAEREAALAEADWSDFDTWIGGLVESSWDQLQSPQGA